MLNPIVADHGATVGCIEGAIPALERASWYLQVAGGKETGRRQLRLESGATGIDRLVEELEQIVAEIYAPPAGEKEA